MSPTSTTLPILLLKVLSLTRTALGLATLLFPNTALSLLLPITSGSPPSAVPTSIISTSIMTRLFGVRESIVGAATLAVLSHYRSVPASSKREHVSTDAKSSSVATQGEIPKENSASESEVLPVSSKVNRHGSNENDHAIEAAVKIETARRLAKMLVTGGIVIDALDVVCCGMEIASGKFDQVAMARLGAAALGAVGIGMWGLTVLRRLPHLFEGRIRFD